MTTKSYLKHVYKESGLRQDELAILWGVSRLMVNRYLTGKAVPCESRMPDIIKINKLITRTVAAGKLPLSADFDKERRLKAVNKLKDFAATLEA